MSSELVFGGGEKIEKLIYEIRGKQVMLGSDLARLYRCKNGTKVINQAVSRHKDRFPEDFCFRLTEEEIVVLRSQLGTSNDGIFQSQVGTEKISDGVFRSQVVTENADDGFLRSQVVTSNEEENLRFQFETSKMRGGRRYKTYVFTEQGVAMLATILRTEVASKVSIAIMRAFVVMRHYFDDSSYRLSNVETKIIEHDNSIKFLKESLLKFDEKRKKNEIFFNGQIYDAYYKILGIFKEATKSLIIIDAYADNTLLDMIKRLDLDVTIITRANSLLTKQDVKKYNFQYNNLKIIYDDTFHDRYFILDNNKVYHCGTSLNRIGHKTFSINLIEDDDVCRLLIERVKRIQN